MAGVNYAHKQVGGVMAIYRQRQPIPGNCLSRNRETGVKSCRFSRQPTKRCGCVQEFWRNLIRLSSSFVRIVLVGIITAMSVSFARADSIIAVTGPGTCPVSGCGIINTLYDHIDFGFNLPSGGLGQFVITNETIFTWKYLSLTGPALAHVAGPISCSSNLFANCSVSTFNGGGVRILFSGLGSGFTGILPGENFSFTFSCSAGPCTWKGNQPIYGFMASTTATPEPGTMALMLTGIAAIAKAHRLKRMGKRS
jgi:hypothetical protein